MKALLIGMDGAQLSTFYRGWTPFIESLINNGASLKLRENLISRGWAEIITGQPGIVTGALYDRPDLSGDYSWSLRFKLEAIPGFGQQIKPLWQKVNEGGYRVGVMNVPTAYPAPEVDGFFVSGGGGGGPVLQDPLPELCHPPEILDYLLESGYIVDERLGSLLVEKKLYEPEKFFGRLVEKNERRTNTFIELASRYEIDFGFLVYKSSSNIAEFLLLPELERLTRTGAQGNTDFMDAVESYYRRFDLQIQRLVTSFGNTEIILVSDHGMAARKFLVNPNAFLVEEGFQTPSAINRGFYDFIKIFKKFIPFSLRTAIRNQAKVKQLYESMVGFNPSETLAFCMPIGDWSHGIYINDQARFGGPVKEIEIRPLAMKIAEAFNAHPLAKKHGIVAKPKPEIDSVASALYPDIELELPNGYMTSNEEKEFISPFQLPDQPLSIDSVTKGRLLCGKANNPIAVISRGNWRVYPSEEKQDLRLIHDQILKTFDLAGPA